jgi:hypothetical protein
MDSKKWPRRSAFSRQTRDRKGIGPHRSSAESESNDIPQMHQKLSDHRQSSIVEVF